MATKRVIKDVDFDKIIIRTHKGVKSPIMTVKSDGLHVKVPCRSRIENILESIEPHREELIKSYKAIKYKLIDYNYTILAPCFHLYVRPSQGDKITYREEDEEMIVYCPDTFDIYSKPIQQILRRTIIDAMKARASVFLPPLLDMQAETLNIKYKQGKIFAAREHWGKCTSTGTISLSCYLLLLPDHLIDYVLCHELAHTKEIKHSPEFWELLNKFTDGYAYKLKEELRSYHLGIPQINC